MYLGFGPASQFPLLRAAKLGLAGASRIATHGYIINRPSAGEIWHLRIDDLFVQLPERVSLGGPGPFVINLSVSTAPLVHAANRQYAAYGAQLYQIKVLEDGRPRYRLRLGPFGHEHEADAALATVRDDYPGALTATALAADLQVFKSMRPVVTATPESVAKEPLVETLLPTAPPPKAVAPPAAVAVPPLELTGSSASRSFAVQLLLADEPPDPEAVSHLDLFSEYRLYAIAGQDQGRVRHALRLGFFVDEAAAKMVASYLSGYYDEPSVVRVSVAETKRFAESRVEAKKDVGATGRHAVIEITGDLIARYSRTAVKP